MNRNRRRFLAVLGLGGAAWFAASSGLAGDVLPSSNDSSTDAESFDASARARNELGGRRERRPDFEFDYDPVEARFDESELFDRAQARPADDGTGDVLQFTPGERSADELADLLKTIWNVDASTTASTTVDGATVELTGGVAFGTTSLVGTASLADEPTVLAVRGESPEAATSLADAAPFPL